MRNYQNTSRLPEPRPTIYRIAFRSHTVVPALGWWIEGDTLMYVNLDHSINQASMQLIDPELSTKLNANNSVDFTLPAGTAR